MQIGDRRRRLQRPARPTSCARRWARSARRPAWPRMRERLLAGMAERGITGETAEEIATKLEAFADFGFPESHSVSFAYLVYSSSWIKLPLPGRVRVRAAERAADGLLLAAHDRARRHAATACRCSGPTSNASRRDCTLEPRTDGGRTGRSPAAGLARRPVDTARCASGCATCAASHDALLDRIDDERDARAVHATSRTSPAAPARPSTRVEALATAGAFEQCFGADPPRARCGPPAPCRATPTARDETLPGIVTGVDGAAAAGHDRGRGDRAPTCGRRACPRAGTPPSSCASELTAPGRRSPSRRCASSRTARWWRSAGVVTHRQQPETAKGMVFLNLEDETGLVNVICTPDVWRASARSPACHRRCACGACSSATRA